MGTYKDRKILEYTCHSAFFVSIVIVCTPLRLTGGYLRFHSLYLSSSTTSAGKPFFVAVDFKVGSQRRLIIKSNEINIWYTNAKKIISGYANLISKQFYIQLCCEHILMILSDIIN